jgi:hypothetical protein
MNDAGNGRTVAETGSCPNPHTANDIRQGRTVADRPPTTWWLWILYLGLLAVLTQGPLRRRWRWG